MKPPALLCLIVVSAIALAVAGCGGSGSSSSTSGAAGTGPSTVDPGGPVETAKAPNAPAGSKATPCPGVSPGVSGLRAVALDCGVARTQMRRWQGEPSCALGGGASRGSCSLGRWRCQAIRTGRGTVVSCARPDGGDVSFVVKR